jgi:outer membrane protein assembly factor BamB
VTGEEKWRFTTGDWVESSPAVASGIVYVGSGDKNLYAIDAVTGEEKWRFATGDQVDSSPAVANGIVYVGSRDKNLYAVGVNSVPLTTVPTTIPSTHITLPGTTIQQTIASTPTTSPISGKNSDPAVALPVLLIIVTIILLAGGEYILYRLKNKP